VPGSDRQGAGIAEATARYEAWLATQMPLVKADLELKHHAMSAGNFPFLRATYYRWADRWQAIVGEVAAAPRVLAVGDLHVENFGTWRDAEGRLIWGVNDFDEAWPLPYTSDLVRLATSALVAIDYHDLEIEGRRATDAILAGYTDALDRGGHALVLAEHHQALRDMAVQRLRDPESYWDKLKALPTVRTPVPRAVQVALAQALPERHIETRIVHRIAGLGSLGRPRFVALAEWRGGSIAREAKALAPSACTAAGRGAGRSPPYAQIVWSAVRWAAKGDASRIYYADILRRGVRCPDPCVAVHGRWLVRRLAPDCSRIPLNELPRKRDEERLLHAMGWETANIHLGSPSWRAARADLKRRNERWLHDAARRMAEALDEDWRAWRKAGP
jgi:uncharacterized protein (DUF2252 family)